MFAANNLEPYFEKLSEKSWVLLPVQTDFIAELLTSAQKKQAQFREATITQSLKPESQLRNDRIFWLNEDPSQSSADQLALQALNQLRHELRDYFRISLTHLECHFSIYEPGQFYVRHRDTTAQDNQRIFSFVIYLNPNWADTDGGHLVGYTADNTPLFKIKPEAGQMILFKSDLEHEVQEAHRTRYALTGWIRR